MAARKKGGAASREIAIYLRLSSADGTEAESNSIGNQRSYLHQWAAREGWQIVAEFLDDGHTGTDFERPGFRALMAALQGKRITIFATTDLSRLGRNYLEVGLLQEKTFPALGVRYIAVNDGYDSARADTGSIDPSLFKNLMNDIYARDCSNKVLRAKRTLQRQGKYLGSAPYGYKLDPADKYHLVPDPDTAPIVQRIYALFLSGTTRTHIARLLMQEHVPCPARTKGMTGRRFTGEWTPTTIKRILTLPTYYGAVTQHTREMVSYKVHKARFLDSADWIVVEGTHEGLVTKADFLQAQKLLETRSYTAPDTQSHRLTGLVYCADCGGKLFAHKVGEYFYLTCYTYSRHPGQHLCTSHAIREDWLEAQVCARLRTLADGAADFDALAQERQRQLAKGGSNTLAERDRLTTQLTKTKKTRLAAYKDLTDGLLTREEFTDITCDLRKEEEQLTERLQALVCVPSPAADAAAIRQEMEDLLQFDTLNKVQLQQFIRRITVDADRKVTIQFAFQAPRGKNPGNQPCK